MHFGRMLIKLKEVINLKQMLMNSVQLFFEGSSLPDVDTSWFLPCDVRGEHYLVSKQCENILYKDR